MRCIIVLLVWLASTALGLGAEGEQTQRFRTGNPGDHGNLRTAASYAHTGNIALAQIETDEAMAAWKTLQHSASATPLPSYQPAALEQFLTNGGAQLATATSELNSGDNAAAGRQLLALRQSFHDLRRSSGSMISAIASSRLRLRWRSCEPRRRASANRPRRRVPRIPLPPRACFAIAYSDAMIGQS